MVYVYDRRKYFKNVCLDTIGRFFIQKLNKYIGTWDIRRVAPQIIAPSMWSNPFEPIAMCPSLQFAARIDSKF